jgi:hypothetical protein
MRRNRSILFLSILTISCSVFISADITNSGAAPTGYTGAEGQTCINCHAGNTLNAAGGGVTIEGLPTTYTPGSTYNFSVKINHGASNRTRWGFAVKAVTTTDPTVVGTFAENNPNARISAGEIGHQNAPSSNPSTNTYTFNNLSWTAPSNPTSNPSSVTFYVVGNAANGTGLGGAYYIYTSTQTITLNTTSISESVLLPENVKIATAGKSILVDLNLSKASTIQPAIYSLGGQKILNLEQKKYNSGSHQIRIDGTHLSSGSYILVIQNDGKLVSRKFSL